MASFNDAEYARFTGTLSDQVWNLQIQGPDDASSDWHDTWRGYYEANAGDANIDHDFEDGGNTVENGGDVVMPLSLGDLVLDFDTVQEFNVKVRLQPGSKFDSSLVASLYRLENSNKTTESALFDMVRWQVASEAWEQVPDSDDWRYTGRLSREEENGVSIKLKVWLEEPEEGIWLDATRAKAKLQFRFSGQALDNKPAPMDPEPTGEA
jgi:hypothetical protein